MPMKVAEAVIGRSVLKPDAQKKVTGGARYVADLRRPGMLYGKAVRSPYAHALIKQIDATEPSPWRA